MLLDQDTLVLILLVALSLTTAAKVTSYGITSLPAFYRQVAEALSGIINNQIYQTLTNELEHTQQSGMILL